jgi:hypothetical protein
MTHERRGGKKKSKTQAKRGFFYARRCDELRGSIVNANEVAAALLLLIVFVFGRCSAWCVDFLAWSLIHLFVAKHLRQHVSGGPTRDQLIHIVFAFLILASLLVATACDGADGVEENDLRDTATDYERNSVAA